MQEYHHESLPENHNTYLRYSTLLTVNDNLYGNTKENFILGSITCSLGKHLLISESIQTQQTHSLPQQYL